jgi:hypothetical protein
MARFPQNELCHDCTQDVILDCAETFGVSSQRPCPIKTLQRFREARAQVGIDVQSLIRILRAGASIQDVLAVIECRLLTQVFCGGGTS